MTTTSYIYRKIEYKNLSKEQKKKANFFKSPAAWALYSFSIAIVIGLICMNAFLSIVNGFSNAGKQQNTLIQQQQNNTLQQ